MSSFQSQDTDDLNVIILDETMKVETKVEPEVGVELQCENVEDVGEGNLEATPDIQKDPVDVDKNEEKVNTNYDEEQVNEDKDDEQVNEDKPEREASEEAVANSSTKQVLKCDLCSYTTYLERRLTLHMDKVHPEQIFEQEQVFQLNPLPFKCDECEYAAAIESYLLNHKKMLHDIVKAKCDKCEFEADIRAEMMCHKMMVHGEIEPYKNGPDGPPNIDLSKGPNGTRKRRRQDEELDENIFDQDIGKMEPEVELVEDEVFKPKRRAPAKKNTNTTEKWYNGCEYQCKICSDIKTSVEHIRNHVKKFHPEVHHTDPSNYEMTREEFFDCVICNENMHRDYLVIKVHVKAKHKMGMVEYARDHVNIE